VTPKPTDSKPLETAADEAQLEHIADEAAQKAGKTEDRYDKNHGLITK
jgi:hypothetical protein